MQVDLQAKGSDKFVRKAEHDLARYLISLISCTNLFYIWQNTK